MTKIAIYKKFGKQLYVLLRPLGDATYEMPCCFRREYFFMFPYISICKTYVTPGLGPCLAGPIVILTTDLVDVYIPNSKALCLVVSDDTFHVFPI